jgi:hypothetical protein
MKPLQLTTHHRTALADLDQLHAEMTRQCGDPGGSQVLGDYLTLFWGWHEWATLPPASGGAARH